MDRKYFKIKLAKFYTEFRSFAIYTFWINRMYQETQKRHCFYRKTAILNVIPLYKRGMTRPGLVMRAFHTNCATL